MTRRGPARPLTALAAVVLACGAPGCADEGDPEYGTLGTCDLAQGAVLGCPPPGQGPALDIEGACFRLVHCGVIPVERLDMNGNHNNDWAACVSQLSRYQPDRLELTLRCVGASACSDLARGTSSPCFRYGAPLK